MAHITQYIIVHKDGYVQEFVGNPQKTRDKAEQERQRIANDDGYPLETLTIVEVPI